MAGIDEVVTRVEQLVAGLVAGATYPIAADRFVLADDRTPLDRYFEGGAARRPFSVTATSALDQLPESGPENVTGNMVDSTHGITLEIAYLAGGGSLGTADARSVTSEQSKDWRRLRRCLAHPDNWDEQNTGLMDLSLGTAKFGKTRMRGESQISILTVPMTVLVRENWTVEP